MVFSDLFFLFVFLPAFLILYSFGKLIDRGVSRNRTSSIHPVENAVLVIFSLLFYAWGEPVYVLLMLGSVLVNYFIGRMVDRASSLRKTALAFGIIVNILVLGTFKYAGFIAGSLRGIGVPVPVPDIALPIGISFYIFQSISYLVDVYRREAPAQKKFFNLLLYISMFPQLIAGPIVRYGSVAAEIDSRHATAKDISDGVFRFLIGLGKKVILANQFSEIADQFLKSDMSALSTGGAWIGIIAFTFQIYFDFSGYSDMAIGIGRCLGFHFCENFNHPYCSRTITEFWRRWHMSLGSFFRDYVYIPLGGNRSRQFLNILIVWFLTGMWHGASWNFIIWGLYFGLIVFIEKFTILPLSGKLPRPLLHMYALLLIVAGWGIFYFEDTSVMVRFFSTLSGSSAVHWDFTVESAVFDRFWLWITAIVFCMPVRKWAENLHSSLFEESSVLGATLSVSTKIIIAVVILVVSVAMLVGATNNAFLYTRF